MESEDWGAPLIKDCLISGMGRSSSPGMTDMTLPELSAFGRLHPDLVGSSSNYASEDSVLNCVWGSQPSFYDSSLINSQNGNFEDCESVKSEDESSPGDSLMHETQSNVILLSSSRMAPVVVKHETIYPAQSSGCGQSIADNTARRTVSTFGGRQRFYLPRRGSSSSTLAIIRKPETKYSNSPSPPSSDGSADVYCQSLCQVRNRSKMHELALAHNLISEQDPSDNRLLLSSEEKRTMLQEGFPLPSRLPFTKQEEECLKLVRRKIKNKLSAQESRRKRKEYMETLEERVQRIHSENSSLRLRVRQLELNNRNLNAQINKVKINPNKNTATTQTYIEDL